MVSKKHFPHITYVLFAISSTQGSQFQHHNFFLVTSIHISKYEVPPPGLGWVPFRIANMKVPLFSKQNQAFYSHKIHFSSETEPTQWMSSVYSSRQTKCESMELFCCKWDYSLVPRDIAICTIFFNLFLHSFAEFSGF